MPTCASCHQPLPWEVDATDGSFAAAVDTKMAVLVDLWAPWCGPCRAVSPAVEDIGRRLAGRLKTVKVNVDEAPAVARRLGVQGIPTLVVWRDGREVARQVGALPAAQLERWVADHIDTHTHDGSSAMTEPPEGARVPVALVGDGVAVPCITGETRPYINLDAAASTAALPDGRSPGERLSPVVLQRSSRRGIQVSAVDQRVRSGPGRRPGLRRPGYRQRRGGHLLSQHHRGHQPSGLPAPSLP